MSDVKGFPVILIDCVTIRESFLPYVEEQYLGKVLLVGSTQNGGSMQYIKNPEDLDDDRTDSAVVLVRTGVPDKLFTCYRQEVRFVTGKPRLLAQGTLNHAKNGKFAGVEQLIRMYAGSIIEIDMGDGTTQRYTFKGNNAFDHAYVPRPKPEPVRFGQNLNGGKKRHRKGKPKPAPQQPAEAPAEAQATATA